MPDILSKDVALAHAETLVEAAKVAYSERTLQPTFHIFHAGDKRDPLGFVQPVTDEDLRRAEHHARETARGQDVIGILAIIKGKWLDPKFDRNGLSLWDHPDAVDVVFASFDHKDMDGHVTWRAIVEKGELSAFKRKDQKGKGSYATISEPLTAPHTTDTMLSETLAAHVLGIKGPLEPLSEAVYCFARDVWEQGLADTVEASDKRGMEAQVDEKVCLRTYVMAGRVALTFQYGEDGAEDFYWVSALAGEGERPSRMGLHGIGGTLSQALSLIEKTTQAWKEGRLNIQDNSDIKLDAVAAMGG